MIFGIVLFAIVNFLYLYIFLFGKSVNQEGVAFLAGLCFFGALISVVSIIFNVVKIKEGERAKNIVGLCLTILALVLFVLYLVLRFNARTKEVGLTIF